MTDSPADALRRAFDEHFARPAAVQTERVEDVLALRIDRHPYVVRLPEVSGLLAGRPLVPVPATARGLLGLAGIDGEVVPVFGLSTLLGYEHPSTTPRWLLLSGRKAPVAFAFDDFDGHLRLPASAFLVDEHGGQVARTDAQVSTVLPLSDLISRIQHRPSRGPVAEF